jgi:hypothetical protein
MEIGRKMMKSNGMELQPFQCNDVIDCKNSKNSICDEK